MNPLETAKPMKMFTEEQLASLLCILNNIQPVDDMDGSPNWWMFSNKAKAMIAAGEATP